MVADNSQLHQYCCGTHHLGGFGGIVCCSGGHIMCEIFRVVCGVPVVCL